MPRIFDIFTFFDEIDVLECRLHELADHVDCFVIVEGDRTHQGEKRDLVFKENWSRFSRYAKKINYEPVILPENPSSKSDDSAFPSGANWERFRIQQNYGLLSYILGGSGEIEDDNTIGASDDDIVFFGDVDEIPRREMTLLRPEKDEIIGLGMRHHIFSLGWLYPEQWVGTGVCRYKTAKEKTLHRIRVGRPGIKVIEDAGWHLSWFGGADACRRKIDSFTHPELADMKPAMEWCIKHGIAYDGRKMMRVRYDPDNPSVYPHYIQCGDMKGHWI